MREARKTQYSLRETWLDLDHAKDGTMSADGEAMSADIGTLSRDGVAMSGDGGAKSPDSVTMLADEGAM